MASMAAAVWYGPGRENFRLEELERPEPGPNEVVMRVRACYFGAMHVRAVLRGHPELRPPEVFGRMVAGDVAAVGANVDGIQEGMRITVNPEAPCGRCFYCANFEPVHCLNLKTLRPGGLAEYVCLSSELVPGIFELPANVGYAEGAYTETLACVIQGILKSETTVGDRVVILGCGGVGLTFVQLAKLRGATKIIVADLFDASLESAHALGATRTVNVERETLADVVREETAGYGADVVIEAVGSGPTYQQAFELLRRGGTMVGFGGSPPGTTFTADPNLIHYRSVNARGSYHYAPDLFRRALDLIASGQIDLDPIITHHLPLARVTSDSVDLYQTPDCKTLVIDI
jgi:L-iditol 2-dehydrogenase